jgi:replicative DNA helicase
MTTESLELEQDSPMSVDAERSILGGILLDNAAFYECADLSVRSFALDSHQLIFRRIAGMMSNGQTVDLLTLSEELRRHKEIESIGGVAYLASLQEGRPRRLSVLPDVDIVREKQILREAIAVCSKGIARAADQREEASLLVADIDRQLLEIAQGSSPEALLASRTESAFDESHHRRIQEEKAVHHSR